MIQKQAKLVFHLGVASLEARRFCMNSNRSLRSSLLNKPLRVSRLKQVAVLKPSQSHLTQLVNSKSTDLSLTYHNSPGTANALETHL